MNAETKPRPTRQHYLTRIPQIDRRQHQGWRIVSADGTCGVALDDNRELALVRRSESDVFTVPERAARALHWYETCEAAPTRTGQVEVVCL